MCASPPQEDALLKQKLASDLTKKLKRAEERAKDRLSRLESVQASSSSSGLKRLA